MKEEIYVCKRLRLYTYLKEKGFDELYSRPDFKNIKYLVWTFKDSKELQAKVKEYYDKVNNL